MQGSNMAPRGLQRLQLAIAAAALATALLSLADIGASKASEPLAPAASSCTLDADHHVCPSSWRAVERAETRAGAPGAEAESCCVSLGHTRNPDLDNCGGSRPVGLPFATRSPVMARHGMAATSQPLSTQVALDILKAGGNAVDAAIAANAMEGVVEPMMNGMGGDLMILVHNESQGKLFGYNGSGRSPKNLTYAKMAALMHNISAGSYIPMKGPLPVSVPGVVKGWCDVHERLGRLPLAQLLAPAIQYAEEGFPVSPVISAEWHVEANSSEITSGGRFPNALRGFLDTFSINGRAPQPGQIFKNPDLANSLRIVAEQGCDGFYNGSIADKIDAFRAVGGTHITREDLATHHGEWVDPVNATYRGRYRLFELPPNPQGIAAIQQLNILENFDLATLSKTSPASYYHLHIEAKKLAFADRAKYFCDPGYPLPPGCPPLPTPEALISKEYAAERAKLIDMNKAADRVDAGRPSDHEHPKSGDTIYLTTADREGNMVSLIQSNFNGFGSGLVVPGLGFALQDRGALFSMAPTAADVFAPGKRPFHTIMPGFVFIEGENGSKPWLSFGVMGGNFQPQGHAQILSNLVDRNMTIQEAGDAARYDHGGSQQPTGQDMTDGGVVSLEAGICPSVADELRRRGHHVVRGPNGGGYQAILRDPEADVLVYHGASEMRKDGQAAGY